MNSSSHSYRFARGLAVGLAAFAVPMIAQAHTGVGHTHGFLAGAGHPVFGFDHVCAMIAVGLWAAQRGGRAIWAVPATFVAVMAAGGALGVAGVAVPLVEPGIVASVLILGLLIAAAVRLPVAVSALVVGLFAIFHGYAHGAEMPASTSGLAYGAGFMLATAALHLAGIGLGWAMVKSGREQFVRFAGGAIAAFGVVLCFA
ncbi:MAG: HupE/UreJ family protein [Opitutaceae bacterium]|nr:HupE/UreJ family protein [Opitutaceae bacterium]